jgi:hypothetical protein
MSIIWFIVVVWLACVGCLVVLRLNATKNIAKPVYRGQFGRQRRRPPLLAGSPSTTREKAA